MGCNPTIELCHLKGEVSLPSLASLSLNLRLAFSPIFPYLWYLKTTIDLPDEIFLKAKVLAAERRTTLKNLLVQALQRFMQTPPDAEEKKRKATFKKLLKVMQASNTEPMVPLTREEIYAEC